MLPVSPVDPTAPALIKRSQTLPPGKATAKPPQNDRPASAPLPLSEREQQVCEYLSQRMSFETIALHLGLSPAAARAYYRRALSKRQRTIALTSLEQGDSSAPRVSKTTAKREQAVAESPCDRLASNRSQRSPFHSPAVEAPVLRKRPNAIDLCVTSLFVMGDRVADFNSGYIDVRTCQINLLKIPESLQSLERLPDQSKALEVDESAKRWGFVGRSHFSQTTITDHPLDPRCRKRTSRRSRQAGVAFRVAVAS